MTPCLDSWNSVSFLKQKTAYEILACLEFRRVLFRSGPERRCVRPASPAAARHCDSRRGMTSDSRLRFFRKAQAGAMLSSERKSAAILPVAWPDNRADRKSVV